MSTHVDMTKQIECWRADIAQLKTDIAALRSAKHPDGVAVISRIRLLERDHQISMLQDEIASLESAIELALLP